MSSVIHARRRNHVNHKVEYLVQWKNLPSDQASWEPEENLTSELQEQMREKFCDKYDYYEIPHVKQPRKQTKRPISPSPPPPSPPSKIVRSDTCPDNDEADGVEDRRNPDYPSNYSSSSKHNIPNHSNNSNLSINNSDAAADEPIPSSSKAGPKKLKVTEFSVVIKAVDANDIIKEMREKGIYLAQKAGWEYKFQPLWNSDEPNPPENDDDDDDFVPGSSRQIRRSLKAGQTSTGRTKKEKEKKTPAKTATTSKSKPAQSNRTSSRRRAASDPPADNQIAAFTAQFNQEPKISLEDIDDISIDPIANDEEVIIPIEVDADDLLKSAPSNLNVNFMEMNPFDMAYEPLVGEEVLIESASVTSVPVAASPPKKSLAANSPSKPSVAAHPPPLKVLGTVSRSNKKSSRHIRDSEVSSTTEDPIKKKKKIGSQSNEPKTKTNINTAKNLGPTVARRSLPPTEFEAQLCTPTPMKIKMKKPVKTSVHGSSSKNSSSLIPLRNLNTSDDGTATTSLTTITPVYDDDEDVTPASDKKIKKELPPLPPTNVVLPVEQVVKTELIKLEKKRVGMLVDPKAQKPSSNLTSLKEQLRLARMKSMPPTPVLPSEDEPSTSASTVEVTATEGNGWDEDWSTPSEAPKTLTVTQPVKPMKPSKSTMKVTPKNIGKKAKPLAGQSGQNSLKKAELRGLNITGYKIPKKAPANEVQTVSENLEDTWGVPFQPELADVGPSSSSGPTSTSASVTTAPATSSNDWGSGGDGWD